MDRDGQVHHSQTPPRKKDPRQPCRGMQMNESEH
jgi:hypothetical protein